MSFETRKNHLTKYNLENNILEFFSSSATVKEDVTIYLDASLKRFETIYQACGSSNSAVKLTIEELEKSSNYKEWIDVCKQIDS